MLGRAMTGLRQTGSSLLRTTGAAKDHSLTELTHKKDITLPIKNPNAFRKRPTKVNYDHMDYAPFLLPSEKEFTYAVFDTQDVFGKRKNHRHSPFVKRQLDLDSNLVLFWLFASLVIWFSQLGKSDEFVNLKENLHNSDMGYLTEDDLL